MKDQKDTNNRWVRVTKISISWHEAMGTKYFDYPEDDGASSNASQK
mgnify:FL=1